MSAIGEFDWSSILIFIIIIIIIIILIAPNVSP